MLIAVVIPMVVVMGVWRFGLQGVELAIASAPNRVKRYGGKPNDDETK